jgi:hypothetical protein
MKKVTLLLIAMLGLAGCPSTKGNSSLNGVNGINANCMNCTFTAGVFSQSVTSQIDQAALTLTLAGDVNQMNLWGRNGQNPIFSYQGPISISGTLNVSAYGLLFGMCQLPPGQYTVRTLQAGTYSMGVFQVPVIEFVGPVRLIAALTEGTILTNGNGVITSFGSMLYGQQGPAAMGGWGYQPNMGNTSCMDTIGVRF